MYFVRTASARDLENVRILLGRVWHATYDDLYGADKVERLHEKWHSLSALKVLLDQKQSEFLVADYGQNIGGMAYAAMSDTMAKTAILQMLYVHPECQRQGVGRDLFAEIENCFPDAEIMRLELDRRNQNAISFYEAHGFRETDTLMKTHDDLAEIELLIFEKPLSGL